MHHTAARDKQKLSQQLHFCLKENYIHFATFCDISLRVRLRVKHHLVLKNATK